jgi:threonine dehydrogenase-like Zn-dependent dehydrogenase
MPGETCLDLGCGPIGVLAALQKVSGGYEVPLVIEAAGARWSAARKLLARPTGVGLGKIGPTGFG